MPKETQNEKSFTNELFTVVDIGTETIKVIIGGRAASSQKNATPPLCIYGIGKAKSNCTSSDNLPIDMRKGEIYNVDKIMKQVQSAIKEAEAKSAMSVQDTIVYAGISGQYMRAENVESTIMIDDSRVSQEDQIRVLRIAGEKCYSELPGDVLQLCLRYYKTEHGITYDVNNLITRNLHAYVQAAICSNQQKFSTAKLMMRNATGQEASFLYTPTLPAYAGMPAEQMAKHSLSLDIGAGLTSFSINTEAGMVEFGHIPVGCHHIENDLMLCLDIDWEAARHVVRNLKSITEAFNSPDGPRTVQLKHRGGRKEREIPSSSILSIVSARVEEIFMLVKKEIVARGSWDIIHGKVFISGGGALLPDICGTASKILELESEIAVPNHDIVNSTQSMEYISDPRWIIPIGMLQMAITDTEIKHNVRHTNKENESIMGIVSNIFKTLINW